MLKKAILLFSILCMLIIMVSCGGNPIIPPVEEEGNIHITDMFWDSYDKVIEITLNQSPSTYDDWTMYINGEKLSMEGGFGNPVIRPNADLDDSPTGLYVGTLPWLGPLTEVDFPCCGTIQFDIPGEGLTNEYEFNLVNFGCETASEEECSQTPPNEDDEEQEIEQEFQDNQEMITHHLEEIAEPGKTPEQYAQELASLIMNESNVSEVEVFGNFVNITYNTGKVHCVRFTDKEEGDDDYLKSGGILSFKPNQKGIAIEESKTDLSNTSYSPQREVSATIPLEQQTIGIQDFSKGGLSRDISEEEKIAVNCNILVWDPDTLWGTAQVANLALKLTGGGNLGFYIELMVDSSCTIDSLKKIINYGMVIIESHGNGSGFDTGEKWTEAKYAQYNSDLDIYTVAGFKLTNTPPFFEIKGSVHFGVFYSWFKKNLPENNNNTIMISNACKNGNQTFWDYGLKGRVGDFFGWDGNTNMYCNNHATGSLMEGLKSGESNTVDAYVPYTCFFTVANWRRFGDPVRFASDTSNTNQPPIISSLSANPPSVNINQPTTITCIASDPDEDSLTYDWTVNAGSFEGDTSGPSVTWRAPSTADIYIVVGCEVSDGEGGEDSESVNITVTESEEPPPATVAPIIHIVYGVADDDGIVTADELGNGLAVLGAGPAYAEIKIYINDICAYTGDVLADGSWWAVVVSELDVDGTKTLYATATEDGLEESDHSNEITFILDTTGTEENDTYTITASAGSHGSISPSGSITVNQGSDKSFTLTPDTGYQIDDVLVDGSSVGAVSSYTFTNVTQDHTIYATFIIEDNGTYDLRDIGPAGGYIFYDKGSYSDGWRYLEAAPASTEWTDKEWGSWGTWIGGTDAGIGSGQSNTTIIVTWLNSHSETDKAGQLCDALVYGGYSDWFLPSKDEFRIMRDNLYDFGVGGFGSPTIYWSSYENDADNAWAQKFTINHTNSVADKRFHYTLLRAARAF